MSDLPATTAGKPAATVLVADDDATIRRNLVRLLRSEGYETFEAGTGAEALAKVHAGTRTPSCWI